MLNQKLQLKLSQKLSPQQIQLMKLIQLTTAEFEQKITNEIEENPALEKGSDSKDNDTNEYEGDRDESDVNVDEYLSDEPDNYNLNYYSNQEENNNFQTKESVSFHQFLDNQSKNLILTDSEKPICEFLIGSIDESGYLRREIEDIIDDLGLSSYSERDLKAYVEINLYARPVDKTINPQDVSLSYNFNAFQTTKKVGDPVIVSETKVESITFLGEGVNLQGTGPQYYNVVKSGGGWKSFQFNVLTYNPQDLVSQSVVDMNKYGTIDTALIFVLLRDSQTQQLYSILT